MIAKARRQHAGDSLAAALHTTIRETSDAGHPVAAIGPAALKAGAYAELARGVWQGLSGGSRRRAAPRIVIE